MRTSSESLLIWGATFYNIRVSYAVALRRLETVPSLACAKRTYGLLDFDFVLGRHRLGGDHLLLDDLLRHVESGYPVSLLFPRSVQLGLLLYLVFGR